MRRIQHSKSYDHIGLHARKTSTTIEESRKLYDDTSIRYDGKIGLFERKNSRNLLYDGRVLEHLQFVAELANYYENEEAPEDVYELERHELEERISLYNRRNHLGELFIVMQKVRTF